jgi:hypothetical protein
MEELERLERERMLVFGVTTVVCFFLFVVPSQAPFASGVCAVGSGLIASGCNYAFRVTRSVAWAHVLSEARLNGGGRSKRGVWLGGIVPGVVVTGLGFWLGPFN